MEVDGVLHEWVFQNKKIYGAIYGDKHGRWRDGWAIMTGKIIATTDGFVEGSLACTENSMYLLGRPA